ncbi:anaerobic carbon-monoxide dehydrogenase catalytic subunit [Sporohalobacter salinus]|uniref:anaerobic carbon-monoxide dehydrogenase catalytic subunit n=1 Tax=Sporohalobacter salinus TaxID=1494606 RepID=UPI00195FB032|nr:anaerobic carbon-monoxide dehydrogenase catalytic subunit [Sporohalobacter salinus]MBM7622601.1 carbon-monoxide dehydrogenase catalytic subunit [Sporohalobacter salinus]
MNSCEICNTADEKLGDFLKSKPEVKTSFNREPQQSVKCGFGLQGVCCRLCSNGPCRITPDSPKGVCGANADTIVARNFLRSVAAGAGCYLHVIENTARNLKEAAKGNYKTKIKDIDTLNQLAEIFDVKTEDINQKAIEVADKVLSDLYKPRFDEMELTKELVIEPRYKTWSELDILPGGAKSEVFDAIVKTSTNLSSDPSDMLMHALSLGIATGVYGLTLTNKLNDILLGSPEIRQDQVGLRTINPDYINIMPTGHQHSLFAALQDKLIKEKVQQKAKDAGAKGFKLIGCTCVGQDYQLRSEHYQKLFAGHAGNNFTSEAILATGGIDLVVSEFNCTIPGLEEVAEDFEVAQICINDVAKKANAEQLQFSPEEADEIADQIIEKAITSYKNRRDKVEIDIPSDHGHDDALTGISENSLREFLGGNYQPLIDLISEGKIKGVAGVVGCSNLTAQGHDISTVKLTKELIKRDILVLSAGCTTGGLENCGLVSPKAAELAGDNLQAVCEKLGIPPVLNFGPCLAIGRLELVVSELAEALEVDIPQLPVVLSAPQWLEEQALADGAFGLTLGLPLHLALPPFVTGSEVVVKTLTEDIENLTGGKLIIEENMTTAANELEDIIIDRRQNLGL